MKMTTPVSKIALENLADNFFQASTGSWKSQRRYYTLKSGEAQEVVSSLTVQALAPGCDALRQLALKHQLTDELALTCGALTTWESNYVGPGSKQTSGSTVFGVKGNQLYRDRGFSTPKPIIAKFSMPDAQTMCLRTEYSGNVFEEEVKLIGSQYRTRQTIISRAGKEVMIGQYLETRVE
ncbi:MAG: phycobiliprotein lyase [Cyanobacteria bacterium P01_C01_bin.70]